MTKPCWTSSNCDKCKHSRNNINYSELSATGHCYMFKVKPPFVCPQYKKVDTQK